MKERERLKERRAVAPVISALVLTALVLAIGGAVWAYSQGAMTISSEDYAESVINMTDTISERFIIEHVAYIEGNLKVWVYNYGSVDIELKIDVENEVESVTHPADPEDWIPMNARGFDEVAPPSYTSVSGYELVIRIHTRRGNNAYCTFIVPS